MSVKRCVAILCLIIVIALSCGCAHEKKQSAASKAYMTGVWITYAELGEMLTCGDFESAFDAAVQKCTDAGITDIFVHTRAFCDSIFKSEYFPLSESSAAYGGDALSYIVQSCHTRNLKVHAWINPYRVRSADSDVTKLAESSPAARWLSDSEEENDKNVCIYEGIYLNPASAEVRRLVIDGIREILLKYDVDGIHFDDYFYPTQDSAFDAASYQEYAFSVSQPLSLEDWRRANVNSLISGSYTAVKFIDKDVIFSVSPSASIETNYSQYFADVSSWIENGCVDYIIPQLYFGYKYPDKSYCFDNLLSDWKAAVERSDTQLMVGLACYKVGSDAQPDAAEWQNGYDIIACQVAQCMEDESVDGHIYFSLSSLFGNEEIQKRSLEEIVKSF